VDPIVPEVGSQCVCAEAAAFTERVLHRDGIGTMWAPH
jgi:hypothetical protein